jgi:5-methylcytosine-specific restriction endonuclease McrA
MAAKKAKKSDSKNQTPKRRTQGMNWITKKKRLAIHLRDGLCCAYCGNPVEGGASLSLDHLVPYSKGGSNDAANLVTACGMCNSSRGNRDWKQFATAAANYRNVNADALIEDIEEKSSRSLDVKLAEKIIEARGTWKDVVLNGYNI